MVSGMTIEERILVGLDDIVTLVLVCPSCKARITRDPDKDANIPQTCGQCSRQFLHPASGEQTLAHQLLALIKLARSKEARSNPQGFELKFELNARGLKQ